MKSAHKIWKPTSSPTASRLDELSKRLGVNELYARLLLNRNITSEQDAMNFFNPQMEYLHDPFLMLDMDRAVERIDRARQNSEKVRVYGDYDVDGTTSIALMYSFLRRFFSDLDYYVPDRDTEGYGISQKSIELAAEDGVALVIALDCGIRSVELIRLANNLNIDFIICDHHEPGNEIPNAIAVLDPKRKDCPYPFKELSGCGIGFKLVQALLTFWDLSEEESHALMDFVAVSIASDLVPMNGENRILAFHGLQRLNDKPSPGLKMIIDKFIQKPDLDVINVVFMIGPRINAAGRLADARAAVRLLLAENQEEASTLAKELDRLNQMRKGLDADITTEALAMLETDHAFASCKTTVVMKPHWHKGVVGIVASRLIEVHYRPTIVLTESNGILVGSARSIEAFDIHEALNQCAGYLLQYGGHKYAAGLKLIPEHLDEFKTSFEAAASELTEEELTPVIQYEAELELEQITEGFLKNLKRFTPYGPGNPEPIFLSRNIFDSGFSRTLSSGDAHLKMSVTNQRRVPAIGAIAFGMGHFYPHIKDGQPFDLLYTIELNHFNGKSNLQLMVKDLRPL